MDKISSIKVDHQEWMAVNLDISSFRNGDKIPEVKTKEAWVKAGLEGNPAWCYYENEPKNGEKYGLLYNWYAVNDPRGLAPNGWYIPNDLDWNKLVEYFGGEELAGKTMKGENNWNTKGNITNGNGIFGHLGGIRSGIFGTFLYAGYQGNWWSSTKLIPTASWYRSMNSSNSSVLKSADDNGNGFSVRCLKDFNKVNVQKSVKIGLQEWMVENLSVAKFNNGDVIPEIKTKEAWELAGKEKKPAWCYLDNEFMNGEKFGKLYNWYAVADPRGLAPNGWHIPSDQEWAKLINYLGGEELAGKKITFEVSWDRKQIGRNESGFSALPGGERNYYGIFGGRGDGCWWSSTYQSSSSAWSCYLTYFNISIKRFSNYKNHGFSVRCIRD